MNDNPLALPVVHFFLAAVITFFGMFILVPLFFGAVLCTRLQGEILLRERQASWVRRVVNS